MPEEEITARSRARCGSVLLALISSLALLAAGAASAQASKDPTVWLCKPGQHPNPCLSSRQPFLSRHPRC